MKSAALTISDSCRRFRAVGAFFLCLTVTAVLQKNTNAQKVRLPNSVPAAPAQLKKDGRQTFESTCAGCHGLDGRGGERGPDISTRPQVVQLSDEELLRILREGRPGAGMPPFDSLGSAKLNSLFDYLRSLQGRGAATVLPGDPQRGKSLFFGRARCSECHMMQGAGGFLGRDLSAYGASVPLGEIRSNILRGGDAANKANKTAVVTMRDASKFTGIVRNEDNFSIQLQSLDGAFHFLPRTDLTQLEFLPQPIMPTDYGATLSPAELNDLVSYLVSAAKAVKSSKKANWEDDH
jgi:cytochrome c oxidase cbb3-type subunit 3